MGLPRACVQARRAAAGRRTTLQAGCGGARTAQMFPEGNRQHSRRFPARVRIPTHVLFDGHFGKKRVLLETRVPRRCCGGTLVRAAQSNKTRSPKVMRPSSGSVRPAIMRSRVVFPAPQIPKQGDAFRTVRIYAKIKIEGRAPGTKLLAHRHGKRGHVTRSLRIAC